MNIVEITPCYRITLENDSYGVETYIDADSKIQITFENGKILTGNIECVLILFFFSTCRVRWCSGLSGSFAGAFAYQGSIR